MQMMNVHKSTGLLLGGLLVPRLALRLFNKMPAAIPGSPAWESFTASASHFFLYVFSIGMPASGIAMGYYGGSGLPFFGYKIPGIPKEQRTDDTKAIAKNSFMMHKRAGQAFEYLVPLHVAGAAMHFFKGQRIFSRINPFTKA
jgi:cytochrome b561